MKFSMMRLRSRDWNQVRDQAWRTRLDKVDHLAEEDRHLTQDQLSLPMSQIFLPLEESPKEILGHREKSQ